MTAPTPLPGLYFIEKPKLTHYLLNLQHPKGRGKAALLIQFGFSADDPAGLADAIVTHAMVHGPGRRMAPDKGAPRLVIEGPLECPCGRALNARTVWEYSTDTEVRFLTLVPLPA